MRTTMRVIFAGMLVLLAGCSGKVPEFDGNFAYKMLLEQCELGARVPGSPEIELCRDYIISKLQKYGAEVNDQTFSVEIEGDTLSGVNIIGSFYPELSRRILFGAHYDTRPWSDKEEDTEKWQIPVPGGNDGASGVAVLLELGRILSTTMPPEYGVDLVFFDLEDMGQYEQNDSWCLGSEYFAQNYSGEKPELAIVIDMIGDNDLEIPLEYHSYHNSPALVRKIWNIADRLEISEFKTRIDKAVFDDHYRLIQAGFNAIDIIDFDYEWWHTTRDTPDKCSAESLRKVGRVLTYFLYKGYVSD
ncbi:MAG: M28 family peptidase [Candidatus Cloacimonetes bacterium]|nr:M28 family peptidase [Candidatus Cloacimonadota bacterium]